ncbi:hypothetical protein PR048_021331 [Dryococelus australis]|uniref:Uncharacterized protein n=1 Tax=Dryococelus australis TaxID=614101 RepID=A0ABQ9GXZ5_9NEOP|nr:hypothetical protein PR048_021331 [Dryococelus australis]
MPPHSTFNEWCSILQTTIWTFNLTIYETGHKKSAATCLLWDESVAVRVYLMKVLKSICIVIPVLAKIAISSWLLTHTYMLQVRKKRNSKCRASKRLGKSYSDGTWSSTHKSNELEQKDFLNLKELFGNSYVHEKLILKEKMFLG